MNYQKLHNYLADELGILPIETEMQEIVEIVKTMLAEEEQDPISPEELEKWKKWAESVKFDEKTSPATVNVPYIKRTPPPTEIPEHYPKGC
jgi:hypothetical protein